MREKSTTSIKIHSQAVEVFWQQSWKLVASLVLFVSEDQCPIHELFKNVPSLETTGFQFVIDCTQEQAHRYMIVCVDDIFHFMFTNSGITARNAQRNATTSNKVPRSRNE